MLLRNRRSSRHPHYRFSFSALRTIVVPSVLSLLSADRTARMNNVATSIRCTLIPPSNLEIVVVSAKTKESDVALAAPPHFNYQFNSGFPRPRMGASPGLWIRDTWNLPKSSGLPNTSSSLSLLPS